jgi:hypothetical protein
MVANAMRYQRRAAPGVRAGTTRATVATTYTTAASAESA